MTKRDCQDIQPLLANYSLGTLDAEARKMVEEHLSGCPDCQRELQAYYQVKRGLLMSTPAADPPRNLRRRLVRETTPGRDQAPWWEKMQASWAPAFQAALAVAVVLLVVVNIGLVREVRKLSRAQRWTQEQYQASQTTMALMTYYDTKVVELRSAGVYGTLVFEPDRDLGVLNVRGLAAAPQDKVYQIWLIEPDQTRISGGTFTIHDPSAVYVSHIIRSPKAFEAYSAIGVTIEPAGGSPGPTGPKVLGTDL